MSPDSPPPIDPTSSPTEYSSGGSSSDPDPTIIDGDDFSRDVLREMGGFLERLGRFWHPAGSPRDDFDGGFEAKASSGSSSFERYELHERVGQGGFGLVFRARDPILNREVALKIPRPEVLMTRSLRRRFLREARAAAALDHPNIIQVFETGQVGPLCFIASAFCQGLTLSSWLNRTTAPIDPRRTARLIRTLAFAVQHAHDRRILHRDLKPSNILLQGDPNEGDLDKFAPRISDFGLAKIMDDVGEDTKTDAPMGSPPYMAPEQALGRSRDVGPGSDVYALGVILYQMLTGRLPFQGESRTELLRRIVEAGPTSPRSIRDDLPRDLDTICLKCLEKVPQKRYSTASALAEDLGRFLRGEPVRARPASAWESAVKWCRRKPWQASAVLLACLSVAGSTGMLVWRSATLRRHNVELQSALELARKHEASTRRLLYDSQVRLAQHALTSGRIGLAQEILDGLSRPTERSAHRGFEWRYLDLASRQEISVLFDNGVDVNCLKISPDGRELCVGDRGGNLVFWNLAQNRERLRIHAHSFHVGGLLYSPDGRALASLTGHVESSGEIKLWDPVTGRLLSELREVRYPVGRMVFSPDSRGLALFERREPDWEYRYWDLSRGFEHPKASSISHGVMAFSADNRWLGTSRSGRSGTVDLRSSADRSVLKSLTGGSSRIHSLAFSADGNILAVGYEHKVVIWNVESCREIGSFSLPGHNLDFSPNGNTLTVSSSNRDRIALLVDIRDRPRQIELEALTGRAFQYAYSPDSLTIAIAGVHLPPTLWEAASGQRIAAFPEKTWNVFDLAYTRDGQSLVFAGEDGRVRRWYFGPKRDPDSVLAKSDKEIWTLAYTPDGSTLASAGDDNLIKLWNPRDGTLRGTLTGHGALVSSIAFSPDGAKLASAGFDNTVRIWDARGSEQLAVLTGHTDKVRAVVFSPDGRKLASAGSDRTVRVWDAETGRILVTSPNLSETVHALAFNPCGAVLVSACNDRTIKGIDAETGAVLYSLASSQHNMALAFSPDGKTLASTDDRGGVTLWDPSTRTKRSSFKGSEDAVWGIAFSPDGSTLATACGDNMVRLWDPIGGQILLELAGHTMRVNSVAFSPDGRTLASCDHSGTIRLWQANAE